MSPIVSVIIPCYNIAPHLERCVDSVLEQIIQNAKGSIEIMCHPGYVDAENGIYNVQRQLELEVLTSDNIINLLKLKTLKK
jgi:predicted glycoside hydrolase/deacetylase ChbG (UPF0249 family)